MFPTDTYPPRPHYVKATARGGQIFRLLAVFEDGKQESSHQTSGAASSTKSSNGNNAFREKEKGRYAQLLNENRQIVYVSLTSKGKFYEIEQTTPQIFQKTMNSTMMDASNGSTPKSLNIECVHRISQIISGRNELPITVRFIAGPQGTSSVVPETLTITKVTTENVIVACPIEDVEARSPLHLRKLNVTTEMQFIKCFLGFENEQKMFANQNIQNILKFCQINVDNFLRMVEFEHLINVKGIHVAGIKSKTDGGLKILKPLNFPRLLRREKSIIAHEKEDSIIFLSKNDLENMNDKDDSAAGGSGDKMKVFQPTKKKWFRNLKSSSGKTNSFTSLDMDIQTKRMSMDRYQDMSKLLQERFGDETERNKKPNGGRPSSEIGLDPRCVIDHNDLRQKSMSLQEMDLRSEYSNKPDLVRIEFNADDNPNIANSVASNSTTPITTSTTINDMSNIDAIEEMSGASLASFTNKNNNNNNNNNTNQQSFISEKLYSEFHVKTKQHSKSSSHLHNLLHFTVPQKMNINEMRKKQSENVSKQNAIVSRSDYSMEPSSPTASYDDDLPYSSVRDSLVMDDHHSTTIADASCSSSDTFQTQNSRNQRHENIYAEICSDYHPRNGGGSIHSASLVHDHQTTSVQHGNSGIRISVNGNQQSDQNTAGPSHRIIPFSDNIYNTLN